MTEDEVIRQVGEYVAGLFPRTCSKCGRAFASLREYIEVTTPIEDTRSYDADLEEWDTRDPFGTLALANCVCRTTLSISSHSMPVPQYHSLLTWLREESEHAGASPTDVLARIREAVRRNALGSG